MPINRSLLFAISFSVLLLHAFVRSTSGADNAASMRLDVTRDTWVSNVGKEADGNNGGAPRIKTKGIQEFAILDLDPKALAGRVISAATLHIHDAGKEILHRATVSSIS